MDKLFVGIDISQDNNAIYIMKPDGEKHSAFEVPNSPSGTHTLSQRIAAALSPRRLVGGGPD